MKIVIDIEDNNYEYIKNSHITYDIKLLSKQSKKDIEGTLAILDMIDTIKNGTPLPKGHGRLIDADKLQHEINNDKREAFSKHEVWLLLSTYNDNLLTIIKADKLCGAKMESEESDEVSN